MCAFFFFFFFSFHNRAPVRHEAVCVSFQSIEARDAVPLVPTKAKKKKSLDGISTTILSPVLPPDRECVSVSACLVDLTFTLFLGNKHLLGPVMTPAGRWQLRPGCTDPKESGLAGRITRQSCNKALSSGLGTNRCTAGLPSQQAPISPRTQSLCHMDASLSGKQKPV